MDNYNDTQVSRKNKHLSSFERGQIDLLHREGLSPYAIAKKLNRASNTIRNELKRGTVRQIKGNEEVFIYYPDTAEAVYKRNRMNSGTKFKLLSCHKFIDYVTEQFKENHFSLDAICGEVKLHNKFNKDEMVCTKTLYNYVDLGLLEIKNIDLPLKMTRDTKTKRVKKHKRKLGKSIEERSDTINNRSEFGHWEIDTVIGEKNKDDSVLLTITERMTRKEIIRKIPGKNAEAVNDELKTLIADSGRLFEDVFKSITADNGSEFANLSDIEDIVTTEIYFAHPYSSHERGTNERHNGLIRRFIPKGKAINNYSIDQIQKIQIWCNSLPRKILGYLTPDEAFEDHLRELVYM